MKNILSLILIVSSIPSISLSQRITESLFYKGSYDNAIREAKKTQKNVFLEFAADDCDACFKMENETLREPSLFKLIDDNYIVYRVNVSTKQGLEIANKFGIKQYPVQLAMRTNGTIVGKYTGNYKAFYLKKAIEKDHYEKGYYLRTSPESYMAKR